jgi:hypothetical protein
MKQFERLSTFLLVAVMIFILLFIVVASAASTDTPTLTSADVCQTDEQCGSERLSTETTVLASIETTTTTTIDLSFLNTTTTQVPRTVPEYRNTEPVAIETTTDRWDQLAQCESGGNWATNTGNGFGGGLQFMHQRSYSTWLSFGGGEFAPHPWEASREQQIVIAERVLDSSGYGAWPGCSRKHGWL